MPDNQVPAAVVFDPVRISEIVNAAAGALATQLSLSTEWERDTSASSRALQFVEDANPVSGVYNGIAHGDWSFFSLRNAVRSYVPGGAYLVDRDAAKPSSVTGAVTVKVDPLRRARLFASFTKDFQAEFTKQATLGPDKGLAYLRELVNRANRATAAANNQFSRARRVNSDISVRLNDALDRAYRISVGASVAFLVVGCLPIAAAGAAATVPTTGAVMASSGSAAMVTVKVAGVGLLYGTLNTMAFDPASVKRARASGVSIGPGAVAGGTNAASTVMQAGLEKARMYDAQKRLAKATLEANSAHASRAVREAMRSARNPLSAAAPGAQRYIPGTMTEIQRQTLQRQQERIQAEVAKKYKGVSRAGSKIFIAVGLYMMRNEIKDAWNGLTTGTDRTR